MSSRSIALVMGLAVFAGGLFLFGPRHCVGRNDGTLDPLDTWDECRTYAGLTVTLPHVDDTAPTSGIDVEPRPPAKPHWTSVIFPLGVLSSVAFVAMYLILEWRRRGLDDLLSPSQKT